MNQFSLRHSSDRQIGHQALQPPILVLERLSWASLRGAGQLQSDLDDRRSELKKLEVAVANVQKRLEAESYEGERDGALQDEAA